MHMPSILQQPSTVHRQRLSSLGRQIGQTPLHEFPSLSPRPGVRIFGKLEWFQFGGSVKARAAYAIIKHGISSGHLRSGRRLLDASSGNTGIAYASLCAALEIPLTLCLPENASKERIRILKGLGTDLILTSRLEGTDGAQRIAAGMAADHPGTYHYADQYNHDANWQAHFRTTAREILAQTGGMVTHFVAGLGTTGTFTGTSRGLRAAGAAVRNIALQPDGPMHVLEGWKDLGTAKVPGIYDATLPDEVLQVDSGEALDLIRHLARREGIILSPSAAANLLGAKTVAERLSTGTVVTILADNGDKYGDLLDQILD